MPWKETDAMKERVKFVLEWEERWNEAQGGPTDMAELCRKYGVSRSAGHAWVKRYRDANHDVRAVEERSRRPRHKQAARTLRDRRSLPAEVPEGRKKREERARQGGAGLREVCEATRLNLCRRPRLLDGRPAPYRDC
jgi:transposase-like protein